jgi:hypothetical protein
LKCDGFVKSSISILALGCAASFVSSKYGKYESLLTDLRALPIFIRMVALFILPSPLSFCEAFKFNEISG